jgi:parallel beta-helix repeat protein
MFKRSLSVLSLLAVANISASLCLPLIASANSRPIPSSRSGSTFISQAPSQSPAVINVAPSGNDAGANGSAISPYRSISAALAKSIAGTIIQIAPGSYTKETGEVFPLKVPVGVKIQGVEGVIISGGGAFFSATFAGQNVAMVAESESQISGITLTNSNPRGYGLWLESAKNVVISNNTFLGSTHDGVFLTGEAIATISNNLFTQNKASGISAVGLSSGEISNNTFDNTGFGLSIGQRSSVIVSSNRIINNVDGVVLTNATITTLRDNLIANNNRNGLVILKDRNGQPSPNLGTSDRPGGNIFQGNKLQDINNATGANLIAVGNNVDASKVKGLVELIAVARPNTDGLTDIKGHWAEEYIMALAKLGVIGGFKDGSFKPDDPVTRAQFAAILSRAFASKPEVKSSLAFKDVPENFWAFKAIAFSQTQGFMTGFKNELFLPSENISRVQVLVALVNGWQLKGGDANNLSKIFEDIGQIPDYAVNAIAAATTNKLVLNYPNPKILEPKRNATRGEVAAFVYQTLVNRGMAQAIRSNYLVLAPSL